MQKWNRNEIIRLLFECGKIALKLKNQPNTVLKEDRTPVTDADPLIEKLITERLAEPEKNIRVIGEETFENYGADYLKAAITGTTWIIDPIDGTANFASGHPIWAISIGFAEHGVLQEGGVYLPELGDLLITEGEKVFSAKVYTPNSADELISNLTELKPVIVPFSDSAVINVSQIVGKLGEIRLINPMLCIGSCVCAGVTLAKGFDCAYISNAKLWDLAGILPVLRNLKFISAALDGSEMNVISGKIVSDFYRLDFNDLKAFKLQRAVILTHSEEAIARLQQAVRIHKP